MQTATWLGLLPAANGQVKQFDTGVSPIVNLFKGITSSIMENPSCLNPSSFLIMSKQAEAAGKQIPLLEVVLLLYLPFIFI